jgi:hypothetical protein
MEQQMTVGQAAVSEWILIVRGEYQEVPGLCLTKPQVKRLWGLDESTCDALLDELIQHRFLRRTERGTYARAD